MRTRLLLLVALVVVLCALPADLLAQGCSMCKAVAEDGTTTEANVFGGSQAVGSGLNKGIILLMIVPYVLLFLFFRKRIVSFWKEFAGAQG
ncbi:MAG TPA: hypothetical protein VHL57_07675 [Flavobacteriales bacterium]|jgi:hypothetical protein|nr:hypothetical protein [Flavobacteriales bacterium]